VGALLRGAVSTEILSEAAGFFKRLEEVTYYGPGNRKSLEYTPDYNEK